LRYPSSGFQSRLGIGEIVDDAKTGILVQSKKEAIERLPQLPALDRWHVRREFERRFSAERMATDHVTLFQNLLKSEGERLLQSDFRRAAPENVERSIRLNSAIQ
jgi:glycosyltransferase involved in cell wall biosynthesis